MKQLLVTGIYNLICIYFAARIGYEVYLKINEERISVSEGSRRPFGLSREEEIKEAQHDNLDTFANIGAAILPILLLTVIYLLLSQSFYGLLENYLKMNSYPEIATIGGAFLAIGAFFLGKKFAMAYLDIHNIDNDLYKSNNIDLIKKRIKRTEISYLSFTFGVLLFNYLDLELKFNIFKGISTAFVAGTIYYIVFLQNTRFPRHLKKQAFPENQDEKSSKIKF